MKSVFTKRMTTMGKCLCKHVRKGNQWVSESTDETTTTTTTQQHDEGKNKLETGHPPGASNIWWLLVVVVVEVVEVVGSSCRLLSSGIEGSSEWASRALRRATWRRRTAEWQTEDCTDWPPAAGTVEWTGAGAGGDGGGALADADAAAPDALSAAAAAGPADGWWSPLGPPLPSVLSRWAAVHCSLCSGHHLLLLQVTADCDYSQQMNDHQHQHYRQLPKLLHHFLLLFRLSALLCSRWCELTLELCNE